MGGRQIVVALAAGLMLGGCMVRYQLSPAGEGGIAPVAVGAGRAAARPLSAALRLPPGAAGPVPVVILLHGCGGIGANLERWADRVVGWGYGALILDSFKPRGVATVCAPARQPDVTRFDRAADVVAAVRWLRTQPGVDATRLALVGFSHGGGTAMTVTLHPYADEVAGSVRGAVDYYGPCRDPGRYAGIPLLALAGDEDTWSFPARTCERFKAALQGAPIEVAVYPGAVHAFDNPALRLRRSNEGHPMQYDAGAADDSFARVRAFLARLF